MTTVLPADVTLKQLRDQCGLSSRQVAEKIAEILAIQPKTRISVLNYERRGLQKYDVIEALGAIYGVDPSVVVAAAKNSRRDKK